MNLPKTIFWGVSMTCLESAIKNINHGENLTKIEWFFFEMCWIEKSHHTFFLNYRVCSHLDELLLQREKCMVQFSAHISWPIFTSLSSKYFLLNSYFH